MNRNQALWLNQNSDELASLAYEEYLKRGPGTVIVKFNGIDPVLSYSPVSQNSSLAYSYDPHTQMSVMIGCDVLTLPHGLARKGPEKQVISPSSFTPTISNRTNQVTVPQ
ncbi:MAG: hypothetical protein AAGD25_23295 [Cyanobacteria bacterium P01_F01_bin.150]